MHRSRVSASSRQGITIDSSTGPGHAPPDLRPAGRADASGDVRQASYIGPWPHPGTLHVTGNDAADTLLNTDDLALLIGMLLDQQVPMEWAFMGPTTLKGAPRASRCHPHRGHGSGGRWWRCSAPSRPCTAIRPHGPPHPRPVRVRGGPLRRRRRPPLGGRRLRRRAAGPAARAARVRRGEGPDLRGHPGQAARRPRRTAGRPPPAPSPTPPPAPWPTSTAPSPWPRSASGRRPRRPPRRTSKTAPCRPDGG